MTKRAHRAVQALGTSAAFASLICLVAAWALMAGVGERSMLVFPLLYLPWALAAIPLALLALLSALLRSRRMAWPVALGAIVLFGIRIPIFVF